MKSGRDEMRHLRQIVSTIWLGSAAWLFIIGPAAAERFEQYFLSEQRLSEIDAVGIASSSDAWVLFEAFAKRFSVATDDHGDPRDIRRMTETGRGDRNALAFLLLNLFRWNGIDAELVVLSSKAGMRADGDAIEYVLVYVGALDQYFDPTLPPHGQPKSADRAWLDGRSRMHFSAALRQAGKAISRCPDSCVGVYRGRNPDAKRVGIGNISGGAMPGAARIKTEAVSTPTARTP